MNIPPSLTSNSPEEIKQFFHNHEKIIYKTLSSFIIPPKFLIFTTLLTEEDLVNSGDQLLITPGICQEYCEKDYELRVKIVGDKIFTARIESQQQEETKIDWRKNQFLKIYTPWELTAETQKKLFDFHKKCGLVYAAYDFIVK